MINFIEQLRDLKKRFIFQGGSPYALSIAEKIESLLKPTGQGDHTSNTIVERLRDGVFGTNRIPLCIEAADEIERLRTDVQHLQMALADTEALELGTAERLTASQAREAKLREALNNVAWLRHPSVRSSTLVEKLERIALDALALPNNDLVLRERLRQERERCIGRIRELADTCDNPVETYGLCMAAKAIQNLGDE